MSKNVSQRTHELFPERGESANRMREGAVIALSNAALAEQCLLKLDALRAYSWSKVPSLPELSEPGARDQTDSLEVWEILQTLLPNSREQRLAYLLYHCGLKPREIVQFCPQEWSDVQEIYRLRHNILDRLMHNADYLQGRLSHEGRS